MRVALIGAGMVSAHHLPAWQRLPGVQVVALCDRDGERAAAQARRFGVPGVWTSVEAMLEHERLDAVDVATPPAAHAEACLAAARRGLAVLCQKPLAPTLAQARALAAQLGTARVMVHENWRFRPHYRRLQAWLQEGRIGSVRSGELWVHSSGLLAAASGARPALVRQPLLATLPRLLLAEVLVHHLDLARWLLGAGDVQSAHLRHGVAAVRGESAAELVLKLPGGGTLRVGGDMADAEAAPGLADRLIFVGSEGEIRLQDARLSVSAGVPGWAPEVHAVDLQADYQTSYDAAIAHFVYALQHDQPFETAPNWHLEVLQTMESAYRLAGAIEPPRGTP